MWQCGNCPSIHQRTNKSSDHWCEFMSYCRRLVRLDWQIVFPDGQISDDLFVTFAHQTICLSETFCPSRRFVRPLVWKRPVILGGQGHYGSKNFFLRTRQKDDQWTLNSELETWTLWTYSVTFCGKYLLTRNKLKKNSLVAITKRTNEHDTSFR